MTLLQMQPEAGGRPFRPREPGNPRGKKPGTLKRTTRLVMSSSSARPAPLCAGCSLTPKTASPRLEGKIETVSLVAREERNLAYWEWECHGHGRIQNRRESPSKRVTALIPRVGSSVVGIERR
jgi:hypothetical protein